MIWDAKIGFGAAYYAEYHLQPRLAEDLDLMTSGGFNVIRVGESVWSTWEPREGEFRPRLAAADLGRGPGPRHRRDHRDPDVRRPAVAARRVSGDRLACRNRDAQAVRNAAGRQLRTSEVSGARRADHPEDRGAIRRTPRCGGLAGRQRARVVVDLQPGRLRWLRPLVSGAVRQRRSRQRALGIDLLVAPAGGLDTNSGCRRETRPPPTIWLGADTRPRSLTT